MSLRRTEPVFLSSLVFADHGMHGVFISSSFHQALFMLLGYGELALALVKCTGDCAISL